VNFFHFSVDIPETLRYNLGMKIQYDSLSEYLQKEGLSQAEFGRMIGRSRFSVSRYVNGTRSPRKRIAAQIARLTGIPLETVLGEEPAA
jgi:transcriptional regulator with XRE-family HTH domain